MTELRYAFYSSNYHRKTKVGLFLFFSFMFLLFSCLFSLIQTQKEYILQFSNRWKIIRNIAPGLNNNTLKKNQQANQAVLKDYHLMLSLLAIIFIIILVGLLIYIIKKRTTEMNNYAHLGMGKHKIIAQFIFEMIFPLIYSFLAMCSLLFLFDTAFIHKIEQLNDQYSQLYNQNTISQVLHIEPHEENSQNMYLKMPSVTQDESSEELMNIKGFGSESLFMADYHTIRQNFNTILKILSYTFFFFLTMLILSSFIITRFFHIFS